MEKIVLTEEEKELLGEYFKTSPINLIRFKSQAVLMREKGLKIKDISEFTLTSQRTIHRWIKGFRERRMASIFSGHQANENASKLTKEQKQQIKEALSMPPSEYGIPKEFWDFPALREYTKAEFGVIYESAQSYHVLLKFSHLSFKYPDTLDMRRDERLVRETMAEIK
ncbi:MAG: IS630 family transposase, partial [wastewater metagenome]|nr:IS630 family transposase [Candidatus Loosdrechtia aerotolerans]